MAPLPRERESTCWVCTGKSDYVGDCCFEEYKTVCFKIYSMPTNLPCSGPAELRKLRKLVLAEKAKRILLGGSQ